MQSTIRFWNADGSELLYEAKLLPTERSSYSVYFNNQLWNINPTQTYYVGHTNLSKSISQFFYYYKTENNVTSQVYVSPEFSNMFEYKENYVRCVGFTDTPNQNNLIIGDVIDTHTNISVGENGYDFYAVYNYRGFTRYFLMKNDDANYYSFADVPTSYKLNNATSSGLYGNTLMFYFKTDTENVVNVEMYAYPKNTTPNSYIHGVSVKPNDVEIIPYTSTIYELYPNTTKFYAVYYYPRESVDSTDFIELFRYNSEQNRVDKTNFLEMALNDEGLNIIPYQMRGACNIIRPTITIALKLGRQYNRTSIDFNYVYIPDLQRYYFVENYTYLTNNLVELNLRIDVLMTYRVGIGQLYGFIDRNEFQHNLGIIDNKQVVQVGYTTKTIEVETEIFQPKHIVDVGEDEPLVVNLDAVTITMSGNGLSLAKNPDTIGG